MGAAPEIEACSCGGPRSHYRKAGSRTALCGLTVQEHAAHRYSGRTCQNCVNRKKEIDRFSTPATARRFQLCAAVKGNHVHIVPVRPHSPEWTSDKTACGKTVEALISYDTPITCERCRLAYLAVA
jgi:hypothetical protein